MKNFNNLPIELREENLQEKILENLYPSHKDVKYNEFDSTFDNITLIENSDSEEGLDDYFLEMESQYDYAEVILEDVEKEPNFLMDVTKGIDFSNITLHETKRTNPRIKMGGVIKRMISMEPFTYIYFTKKYHFLKKRGTLSIAKYYATIKYLLKQLGKNCTDQLYKCLLTEYVYLINCIDIDSTEKTNKIIGMTYRLNKLSFNYYHRIKENELTEKMKDGIKNYTINTIKDNDKEYIVLVIKIKKEKYFENIKKMKIKTEPYRFNLVINLLQETYSKQQVITLEELGF